MTHRLLFLPVALVLLAQCAGPGKQIEVDLSAGRLYAREGSTVVLDIAVTLGTLRHPVQAGTYHVESKESHIHGQVGSDAFTVYWLLYLDDGDTTIHGRHFKKRMGHVMDHNAITLRNEDAEWLYNWAEVGTPASVHD